mgnify:CR=1 FL=1
MAEIAYNERRIDGNVVLVTWTPITEADTAQPYPQPYWSDSTIHIFGTIGAGGNLRLQGSNEFTSPSNWATLKDTQRNLLNIATLPVAEQVLEHMYQVRPHPTAGVGMSLTVIMQFTFPGQRWRAPS